MNELRFQEETGFGLCGECGNMTFSVKKKSMREAVTICENCGFSESLRLAT